MAYSYADWNELAWSDREHGTLTEDEVEAIEKYDYTMKWMKSRCLLRYDSFRKPLIICKL